MPGSLFKRASTRHCGRVMPIARARSSNAFRIMRPVSDSKYARWSSIITDIIAVLMISKLDYVEIEIIFSDFPTLPVDA